MATFKIHRYTVTHTLTSSVMSIPFDMIRYDACWPAAQDAAASLALLASSHYPREDKLSINSIDLCSHKAPTVARWASFGFIVSNHRAF